MANRIDKLPEGLRQDYDLSDGVYVGSRYHELEVGCTKETEKDQHPIGTCENTPPNSAFINDKDGIVYIPTADGNFLKLDAKDKINNKLNFGDRITLWLRKGEARWNRADWKYAWSGADGLSAREMQWLIEYSSGRFSRDEIWAYLLEHRKERKDLEKEIALILDAASRWVAVGKESKYASLAKEALTEIFQNRANGEFANKAGKKLYYQATTQEERNSIIDGMLAIAQDETVDSVTSYSAVSFVMEKRPESSQQKAILNLTKRTGWNGEMKLSLIKKVYDNTKEIQIKSDCLKAAFGLLKDRSISGTGNLVSIRDFIFHEVKDPELNVMRSEGIFQIAWDKEVEPWVRIEAATFLRGANLQPKDDERGSQAMLEIAWNGGNLRFQAANLAYEWAKTPAQKEEVLKKMLYIASNRDTPYGVCVEAINFVFKEGPKKVTPAVMQTAWDIARNQEAGADKRFEMLKFVHQHTQDSAIQEETLQIAQTLAESKGEDLPWRTRGKIASWVFNTALEKDLRRKALATMRNLAQEKVEGELWYPDSHRMELVEFAFEKAMDEEDRRQALRIALSLSLATHSILLESQLRLAEFVHIKAQDVELRDAALKALLDVATDQSVNQFYRFDAGRFVQANSLQDSEQREAVKAVWDAIPTISKLKDLYWNTWPWVSSNSERIINEASFVFVYAQDDKLREKALDWIKEIRKNSFVNYILSAIKGEVLLPKERQIDLVVFLKRHVSSKDEVRLNSLIDQLQDKEPPKEDPKKGLLTVRVKETFE